MRYVIKSVFVLLLLLNTPLFSQQNFNQTQIDSVIKNRWHFLTNDYPHTALSLLKIIRRNIPNEVDTLLAMASDQIRDSKWTKAAKWFEIVLRVEPENLQANYGLGICKREIGKNKPPILSQIEWRRSQRCFENVIKLDPTFENVYYQWALLERYRENYYASIDLAHQQLSINKFTPSARFGIFRLYDSMLINKSSKEAEAWLKFRRTEYDIYFLGELYRRTNQFDKADSVFQTVLNNPGNLPLQPILLSLVRLYMQHDEPQRAHETYWKAVDAVNSDLEAKFLLEDIMYIVNEKEYKLIKGNLSYQMVPKVLRWFWTIRDPLPAASYNNRLVDHYRRIIYAEENYRYDGFRRHKLAKLDMSNIIELPDWYYDNDKFNDMGLIYIRFGKPDDTAFIVAQNLPDNISWLYRSRGNLPKMIFHFTIAEYMPPGYWTLTPGFSDLGILETMLNWDSYITRLLSAHEEERPALILEMAIDRAEMVDRGFKTDRHTWPEETKVLDMAYSIAQFRQSEDSDLLQLAYSIPLKSLFEKKVQPDSIKFETGIAVFDTQMVSVFKDNRQFIIKDDSDSHVWNDQFIYEYEFPLELKSHNIALYAKVPAANKLNGWKFVYRLSDSNRNRLACSTLKLAFHISSETNTDNHHRDGLKIIPNPSKKFNKKTPIYAYYEIYNLTYNDQGITNYTVNITVKQPKFKKKILQRILGIFSRKDGYRLSIQNDQSGTSRDVFDYIDIDISRLKKGAYNLTLEAKDNLTGEEVASKAADFVINGD